MNDQARVSTIRRQLIPADLLPRRTQFPGFRIGRERWGNLTERRIFTPIPAPPWPLFQAEVAHGIHETR